MATQQLPSSLPPGWESDYDGTSQRWFFVHRPTGFSQFFFPKAGDEHTRIAELAQPQPTNGSLISKMDAMTISTNPSIPNQQAAPMQQPQNPSQTVPQASTPQPTQPSHIQQSPQGSPIARTISQNLQRKAIPRRDSVQSQGSTRSSQSAQAAPQPVVQQFQQGFNSQSTTMQILQNAQHTQQAQQYQQPQQVQQIGQMQQGQPIQHPQQTPQYIQNQQPQQTQPPQQALPYIQNQQTQQSQQSQQFVSNGQVQYQQTQPLQMQAGQYGQTQVPQSTIHSPQSFGAPNQVLQQHVHPQQMQQTQQYQNAQIQPQYTTTSPQGAIVQQNTANGQRRFSTIPVLHQPNNGQITNSPPPAQQQQQVQGTRHSSIPLNNFQPQPLMTQGQQIQQPQAQIGQNGQVILSYAPQMAQPVTNQIQQPPAQYVQQNIATQPQHLPPPAPGMQWVLVQPGAPAPVTQSSAQPVQNGQQVFDPNKSPDFSVQMQQFGGAPINGTAGRPGLVNRLSSSTVSSSKKAFEASKGFVKKHPGKTMAIVGGLGLVAEACGVNVISDAVAGSKVYANVQNSKNRKKLLNAAQTPAAQQTQVVNQVNNQAPNRAVNSIQHLPHVQVAQQHPQVLHQQNHLAHPSNIVNGNPASHSVAHGGLINPQQTFIPQVQQVLYQHASHQQFVPQQHHHHQHATQQFDNQQNSTQSTDPSAQFAQAQNAQPQYIQQNGQPMDPSSQFIQNQNSQPQYNMQQNPPVQYYQPVDNSQQQFQQNPSPVYGIQDTSGQNNQQGSGGMLNYASDAYNMLPNGQGNTSSQPQSPSLMTADNQLSQQQQQLPTPTTSPFDASSQQFSAPSPTSFDPSSQQLQQMPGLSTSPFDPSQVQQFPAPSSSPFDPSAQIPQQQLFQDQTSNQAITGSQQFDNDLLGQSAFNTSIQDDNSYITSPSGAQYSPNLTGQSLLNTSIQDDNSYMNAPSSPTFVDAGSDYGLQAASDEENAELDEANEFALEDADTSAGLF